MTIEYTQYKTFCGMNPDLHLQHIQSMQHRNIETAQNLNEREVQCIIRDKLGTLVSLGWKLQDPMYYRRLKAGKKVTTGNNFITSL